MDTVWTSIHIFLTNKFDYSLRFVVNPLLKELVSKDLIKSYFFIRYGEGGPHIRLRLLHVMDSKSIIRKIVNQKLLKVKNDSEGIKDFQFITYEREYKRYGGKFAIKVAEKHFQSSSNAYFNELDQVDSNLDNYSIGLAIKYHIGFVKAVKMPNEEIVEFFRCLSYLWLNHKSLSKLEKTKKEIINMYHERYNNYSKVFEKLITNYYLNTPEDKIFNLWIKESKTIEKELNGLMVSKSIELSKRSYNYKNPLWSIYFSYMHMTNNRFGVKNIDEPFIFFVLYTVFKNKK